MRSGRAKPSRPPDNTTGLQDHDLHSPPPQVRGDEAGSSRATPALDRGIRSAPRLITKKELSLIIPYTHQHILRLEKRGQFPRRIQVGPNRVAWLLSEIEAWIEARAAARK